MKSKQKHPRCKKGAAKNYKGLVEETWNQNGRPKPPAFDKIKILIIMTSLQNIVILGAQGLLMLMGSKFW